MPHPAVLLLALLGTAMTVADAPADAPAGVRLTVLYDNTVGVEGTRADWGFAVLVERDGTTVLFDTGTEARILEQNVRTLGVDLAAIDAVVLSHDHGDHTGGLGWVLEQHHDLVVYAPSSFSEGFAAEVREAGARAVVTSEPSLAGPGIHTSGTVAGDIPEQALLLETADGLLVITGCAHPGVVDIVRHVRRRLDAPVRTVIGGFHLLRHSREGVVDVIDQLQALGVHTAGATHCTGEEAIELFRERFGPGFIELGTGRVVDR